MRDRFVFGVGCAIGKARRLGLPMRDNTARVPIKKRARVNTQEVDAPIAPDLAPRGVIRSVWR